MKNTNRAMRKTVTHLNNRELKEFEIFYQTLGSLPEWDMKGLFVNESFERDQCMNNLYRSFSTSRGKLTRLAVAAHEAGHAIAMAATYGHVGEAVIDITEHPDGVLGWVTNVSCNKHKTIKQEVRMPSKPEIIRGILIDSAGFVAEAFAGRKTGSNHEKWLIYCGCRYLDDLVEAEPLTNWIHYINWCRKIILNNQTLFWRVTDDLLEHSKLTNEMKTILHANIRQEAADLFF